MALALTDFEALCGFVSHEELVEALEVRSVTCNRWVFASGTAIPCYMTSLNERWDLSCPELTEGRRCRLQGCF